MKYAGLRLKRALCFTFAAAFEDGNGCIIVYGSRLPTVEIEALDDDSGESGMGGFMHMWKLDLKTKSCIVDKTLLPGLHCDFARIPSDRIGKRVRYGYAATFSGPFTVDGIVKFDFDMGTHTLFKYGAGVYGGETIFARRDAASASASAEDDGYLLTYTYGDPRCRDTSSIDIVNAKTMKLVTRVKLPRRVPAGFHAEWIGA